MVKALKYLRIKIIIMGVKVVMYAKCLNCEHIWPPRANEKVQKLLKKKELLCPSCKKIITYGGESNES